MARKFDEIVTFSGLARFIDVPVRQYSSGMYVRLGFSVATSVDPDILLIDEILAVGDEAFQKKCLDKIYALKAQGKTIVFVSHGLPAVRALCDQAMALHKGRILSIGDTEKVIADYLASVQGREGQAGITSGPFKFEGGHRQNQ